jgi:hypothetical protein
LGNPSARLTITWWNLQGYSGSVQQQCARNHSVEDPQFYGSASFTE